MNRHSGRVLAAVVLAGAFWVPTLAWGQHFAPGSAVKGLPRINRREFRQKQRIRQGVRSGELTRPETKRLVRQQARVRRHEARAKSDGVVTRQERWRLNRELNRASRHIYRQKHDRQRRG